MHEELAPLGYATASDVTFTVNEDGSVTKVKMKDEITKVDISKVDATTGKEIEGAKLTLKDKETGEVQKVVMKDEAKPVVVKTGDDSNMSFYIAMGMFALGLIVCFYAKRKYVEKNDK